MIILEAMVQDNIVISFEGNVGPDSIINNGDNGYLVNYEMCLNLQNVSI